MGHAASSEGPPCERPDLEGWTIRFQDEYHRFYPHNLFEHVYPGGRRIGTYSVLATSPLCYCYIPIAPVPTLLQYTVHAGGSELHNEEGQVVACTMAPSPAPNAHNVSAFYAGD